MRTYKPITGENRAETTAFLRAHWGSDIMILRGETHDITALDGLCAYEDGRLVGLLTYRFFGDACELMSLDSLIEGQGIASALMAQAEDIAKDRGAKRLLVITTNDNLGALRLYQRRGFDLIALRRNALDATRKIKPNVPLVGEFGIPLKHELELEKPLA